MKEHRKPDELGQFFKQEPNMKSLAREAIVHIGTEKTGTTSIQLCLNNNRELLLAHGCAYLKISDDYNHRVLATYCMSDDMVDDQVIHLGIVEPKPRARWRKTIQEKLNDQIRNLPDYVNTVIFSSEHLHSRIKDTTEVERLQALLSPHFDRIRILVYLRRQDHMALGIYSTRCKAGVEPGDYFPEISDAADAPYFNHETLIHRWAGVFGKENLMIRVFDESYLSGNLLLTDFFSTIEQNHITPELIIPPHQNPSLLSGSLIALSQFNRYFASFENRKRHLVYQTIQRRLLTELEQHDSSAKFFPPREEAIRFYLNFKDSNNRVAINWLKTESLFDNDFSMYPEIPAARVVDEALIGVMLKSIREVLNDYLILPVELMSLLADKKKAGKNVAYIIKIIEDYNPGL